MPVIDIDCTWHTGRENENFGEDPFLTGSMVAPEVRAIQAQGVLTTVKHCCAYTQEQGRAGQALALTHADPNTGENEQVSERALEEIYGLGGRPQWGRRGRCDVGHVRLRDRQRTCNPAVTGADSCGNKFILNDLIKGQYGFQGTFTPDAATAMRDTSVLNSRTAATVATSASRWCNCRRSWAMGAAMARSTPTEARTISQAGRRRGATRRAPATKNERFLNPPTNTGIGDGVAPDEATSAAIEEGGAVLLKDQRVVLPIGHRTRSIAVIGTQPGPTATGGRFGHGRAAQVDNDGSPFVNPAKVHRHRHRSEVRLPSALSGILAGPDRTRPSPTPGSVGWPSSRRWRRRKRRTGLAGHARLPASSWPPTTAGRRTDPADTTLGTEVLPAIQ